jgi:hypothetical protein
MKKTIILLTSLILILTVTACSGQAAASVGEITNATENSDAIPISEDLSVSEINVAESGSENPDTSESAGIVALNTDYENALPVQMQLILGTVMLDETEYAIGADQAVELLPLWKAARSLSQSETAATQEIEAIFNQIADMMTTEQLGGIVAMQLSRDDLTALAGDLGIEIGGSGGKFGDMTPEEIEAARAARGGDQTPPGDGVPGAGPRGAAPGGSPPDGNQGAGGAAGGINALFFDAIIELLEVKIS